MENEPELAPLPPSDESERKRKVPHPRRRTAFLLGLTATLIIGPFIFLAWDYSACPLIQVVPAGTTVSIPSRNHVAYGFDVTKQLSVDRPIFGSLNSNASVVLYIMTAGQYKYWNATGSPGPYEFNSGSVTSLSYHTCNKVTYCAYLPPSVPFGPDDLVLYNPGNSAIAVAIGTAMVVQPC